MLRLLKKLVPRSFGLAFLWQAKRFLFRIGGKSFDPTFTPLEARLRAFVFIIRGGQIYV